LLNGKSFIITDIRIKTAKSEKWFCCFFIIFDDISCDAQNRFLASFGMTLLAY